MIHSRIVQAICAVAACVCNGAPSAQVLKPVVVAQGLVNPWAMAFLPDGRVLVMEKAGGLRIVDRDGRVSAPLGGLPAVADAGRCGLLDVVRDPKFALNQRIFFTFAELGEGAESGTNSTAVGRVRLVSVLATVGPGTDKPVSDVASSDKLL